MTNLTIALPDSAQAYINAEIASGRYQSAEEVVAALIECAQEGQIEEADRHTPKHLTVTSREHLDMLLREGMESGDTIEVTDEWWVAKRQHLLGNDRPRP
jgi:antitoxin ParD1/3/4